ncbi:MAG: cache domain-containing protein [Betaproteobacteria bacterium]
MALGFRAKITGAMLVGALVPLLAFGLLDYFEFKQEAVETVRHHLATVAERQSVHIADLLDGTRRGLRVISSQPVLSDLDAESSRPLTKIFVKNYDWVRNAYIADKTGQQFVRDDESVKLVDISERDYFKNALEGKTTTQVSISKSIGKPVLLSGAPIYSKKNPAEVVGVFGFSAELTDISKIVVGERVGSTGFSFLLDETGRLVAHPDKKKTDDAAEDKGEDFRKHPALLARPPSAEHGQNQKFVTYVSEGREWLGIVTAMSDGWTLVTQMEMSEVLAPLDELKERALVTLMLAIVFVSALSFVLGRALSLPIIKLTKVTDSISRGDFDEVALNQIASTDEIGALADSVRRLSASVKIAMEMLSVNQKK